tara:strand:+ start:904 stop:1131 length:228 start_codon:yes stop_codon:yes gene_type:complete
MSDNTVLIVKPVISNKIRKWIKNISKISKPKQSIKEKKLKKRIYDLKYYEEFKNEINTRQRRNYDWRKNSNTKFI